MSEDILANIQQEGLSMDEALTENSGEQETETPADSPAEDNHTEQSPSSQGEGEVDAPSEEEASAKSNTENANNIPYNKDPRWQSLMKERDDAREEATRLRAEREGQVKPNVAPITQETNTPEAVPKAFAELFGEDENTWNKWQELSRIERENVKKELIQDQARAQEAVKQEAERWEKWVESSVQGLETKHGVALSKGSSDFNEVMKVTLDYLPTDDQGNISFEKGYDLMMKLRREENQEKSKARKSIAAATASDPVSEPAPKDYYTPKDLKRGWNRIS